MSQLWQRRTESEDIARILRGRICKMSFRFCTGFLYRVGQICPSDYPIPRILLSVRLSPGAEGAKTYSGNAHLKTLDAFPKYDSNMTPEFTLGRIQDLSYILCIFRCTTPILTRCRGRCAWMWSTRPGPLSMISQISSSLSCHRYRMKRGQVWVYLVQVSSLSPHYVWLLLFKHIPRVMVTVMVLLLWQLKSSKCIVMLVHSFKTILKHKFQLLTYPNPTDPLNGDAAAMYLHRWAIFLKLFNGGLQNKTSF